MSDLPIGYFFASAFLFEQKESEKERERRILGMLGSTAFSARNWNRRNVQKKSWAKKSGQNKWTQSSPVLNTMPSNLQSA